jgi:hypothetical protein
MAVASSMQREGVARVIAGDAPAGAAVVAYLALLPFFLAAALYAIPDLAALLPQPGITRWVILGYAAFYLGILAGVAIGATLRGSRRGHVPSLIPPILALACFYAPFRPAIAVIAMLVAAQGASDVWASQGGRLPDWYGQIRARTAPLAVIALVAIFLLLPAEIG